MCRSPRPPRSPSDDSAPRVQLGRDLTASEGIDDTTALILVSEIGFAMSRWPTVKHFASWLGLCPHQQVAGGKVLSRRTKLCATRAAAALRLAASCLHHSQSAWGAFCRRMKARLGTPKATTATAHKLARLVYTMVKHGTVYVAQGMADDEQRYQERVLQHLTRRAKTLGYALMSTAEGAPASPPGARNNSLEGPLLSRDTLLLCADFPFFLAFELGVVVGWSRVLT
jgi:hypothetical protein